MLPSPSDRLESIHVLRGMASLLVCLFHAFYWGILPPGMLQRSFTYGWVGVQLFFVISGFVIPYSLWQARYALRHYGKFLAKRVVRLDPPYLVAIAVIVVIAYTAPIVPGFQGAPPHITLKQVLLHFAYMSNFFGHQWLTATFWTLGIEFQWYLLVGLVFPIVASKKTLPQIALLLLALAGAMVRPDRETVFVHLPVFFVGVAGFQYKIGNIGFRRFLITTGILITCALLVQGPAYALAAGTAVSFILLANPRRHRVFHWFGDVSYSLYLIHLPLLQRLQNIGARFTDGMPARLAYTIGSIAAVLVAAHLLCMFVERPAQRYASRIQYKTAVHEQPQAEALASVQQ